MIDRIAIEGIDGAGKTTTCETLAGQLKADGLKVVTFTPYRTANEYLGEDIYNLWFGVDSCLRAICTLREVIDDCEAEARKDKADVVIYDRHWMTALKMIEGRDTAEGYWYQYGPKKIQTALLRVPVETALERRADEKTEFWTPYMDADQMGVDAADYALMSKQYGEYVLGIYRSDNDVPPAEIAKNIAWDMRIKR